jgi:sterol desaturase/sphingolipid hydroxylase (fatty acid hydroxylase superfamily)
VLAYAVAACLVGVLSLIELRAGARLDRNRMLNVGNWIFRIFLGLALFRFVALKPSFSLIDGRTLPAPVAILGFLVVMDLGEYLFHRAQHAIPFLWALHSLHHSDPDMNATTTERHHWADQFLKSVTIWPAAVLILSPTAAAATFYLLMSMWNYVAHAGTKLSFGRFSWLLNSPAYHRRHHSSLPEHYNSNYAALLPLWDVLLGSYYRPEGHPPTGIAKRPESFGEVLTWPLRKRPQFG